MAEKKITKSDQASAMDYEEHDKTYDLFIAILKYSTIATIVILVLMAFFLL